jgi:hypothetical protein
MSKAYSFDPFNDFAALADSRIKFGGQIPELGEQGSMWFLARIGDSPADRTNERGDTIEVGDGYCRALAALAGQLHQKLIEHAESHRSYRLLRMIGNAMALLAFSYFPPAARVRISRFRPGPAVAPQTD